jgi:hypothetical protein
MNFYDQQRAGGTPRAEAMTNAVRYTWRGDGPARPHGGRPPTAGALPRLGEELETALADLARAAGPIERSRLLRHLEDAGWSTESIDHIETVLDRHAARAEPAGDSRTAAQVAAESFRYLRGGR